MTWDASSSSSGLTASSSSSPSRIRNDFGNGSTRVRNCRVSLIFMLISQLLALVSSQVYTFSDTPVPQARSLHVLYGFYIYSPKDSPTRIQETSHAFVTFQEIVRTQSPTELEHYKGVQLTLILYENFLTHVDKTDFCCFPSEECKEDRLKYKMLPPGQTRPDHTFTLDVVSATLQPPQDFRQNLTKSGVYILVFSNCGKKDKIKISGNVVVRSPYGYLPGNDYYKWPFCGVLACIFVVLALYWGYRCCRYWKELFKIHWYIGGMILLGLIEAAVWHVFYDEWNDTGRRPQPVFIVGIIATVTKNICGQVLLLLASIGWGITKPHLERGQAVKIQIFTLCYLVLDGIQEVVLALRHSLVLPLSFVMLCLVPVALLHGGILYWIFISLSGLINELEEKKQTEKLNLFCRLWKALVISVMAMGVSLLYQLYSYSTPIKSQISVARWSMLWFFTDALNHGVFLFILMTVMFLWLPSKTTQAYAFSQQIEQGEVVGKELAAAENWLQEEEDPESFWAQTKEAQK